MMKSSSYILNLEGNKLHSSVEITKIKDKKKYNGSFDYSLLAIQIYNTSKKLYPKNGDKIFYIKKDKQYTDAVINVNFTYSIKKDVVVTDENGNITTKKNKNGDTVRETTIGLAQLRNDVYKNGFDIIINGKLQHMVKLMRSNGSSRQGRCLFIRQDLYSDIMTYSLMGLHFIEDENADLPALESYLALTASSIIDTIEIDPKSILVIKDCTSTFKEDVMLTTLKDGELTTELATDYEITNKLFDGESLLDSSVYGVAPDENIMWVNGKYSEKSMLLLRNQFLKTNGIHTRIQQWFSDNGITDIKQLNGFTLADNIKQIQIITTDSSLKFLKFKDQFESREVCLRYYLENLTSTFGVVKYDKGTKYMDSMMAKSSYQLLNTIEMDKTDLQNFMQPTIDYINLLQTNNIAFKYHLHLKIKSDIEFGESTSADEFILNMMLLNNKFTETEIFIKFKDDTIENYKNNVKKGRVLINGNFETIICCPIEMLQESIGTYVEETSLLEVGQMMTKRFEYKQDLLCARSPHVCQGNLLVHENVYNADIDKYIHLTNNMVVISAVKENILNILSGSDEDGDTMLITDSKQLLLNSKKYYGQFLVPVTDMEGTKSEYTYCLEDMATMDLISADSAELIGEIVNLSQFLVSILWDRISKGETVKDVEELYSAITELDVLSGCAIDGSKKTFKGLNIKKELRKARAKWLDREVVDSNKNIAPVDIQKKFVVKEDLQMEIKDLVIIIKEIKNSGEKVDEELKDNLKTLRGKLKEYKKLVKGYNRKAVRPLFFKFIKNQKNKKIIYTHKYYNCTMDNICKLLPTQIKPRKSFTYMARLLQCFNEFKVDGKCDFGKKSRFTTSIFDMEKTCKKIMAEKGNMEMKEVFKKQSAIKLEVINQWTKKLDAKTIQNIITEIGHKDTYNKIERKLVNIMYKSNKQAFLSLFTVQVDSKMEILKKLKGESDANDNVINIYGFDYVSVTVKRHMDANKILDINKLLVPIAK